MKPAQIVPPAYDPGWTQGFRDRPAISWSLVRQAVIQSQIDAAPNQPTDTEFRMVRDLGVPLPGSADPNPALYNLYSPVDVTQWINSLLDQSRAGPAWGNLNWTALLWPPRVYNPGGRYDPATGTWLNLSDPRALNFDPKVAPARVLLPHAARLRFQVRLSDGSIIPQLDETNGTSWLRGRLDIQTYAALGSLGRLAGLNPDCTVGPPPPPPPPPALPTPYMTWDPTKLTPARGGPEIPLTQTLYAWTPDKTNLRWTQPSTPMSLYPVAVRIRMEVYDPQRRTPDPIRVDEWIPVRWASKPDPAP